MFKKVKVNFLFFLFFINFACNDQTNKNILNEEYFDTEFCKETTYYRNKFGNLSLDSNYICEFKNDVLNRVYYISRKLCSKDITKPSFCIYSINYYNWYDQKYEVCTSVWEKNNYTQLPCKKFQRK